MREDEEVALGRRIVGAIISLAMRFRFLVNLFLLAIAASIISSKLLSLKTSQGAGTSPA